MRARRFLGATVFVTGLAMALTGCGDKSTTKGSSATNASASDSGSPLTAPVDYLGAVGKAQQSAVKNIDLASVRQAIQMYKVEEGKNPANLQELVTEKYMPRLPDLPKGMKYQYDPNTGDVKAVKQ